MDCGTIIFYGHEIQWFPLEKRLALKFHGFSKRHTASPL